MKIPGLLFVFILSAVFCLRAQDDSMAVSLVVLGTVQDAGSPQINCKKECCQQLLANPDPKRMVSSLGLIDRDSGKNYLFDATPDLAEQLRYLSSLSNKNSDVPDGVFLTHAHIGHYSGLMFFGMEAAHTSEVEVFAMPRMKNFLETNGPWSQLLSKNNIRIQPLEAERKISLSDKIKVKPMLVPHRDEYSETVGYLIEGPNKKALFIPDVDKWSHWDVDISELIIEVDYAFLDATFYNPEEIPGRDLTKVLHPFVIDSMARFEQLSKADKDKIYFIHFNHTNRLLLPASEENKTVLSNGFHVAEFGDIFKL